MTNKPRWFTLGEELTGTAIRDALTITHDLTIPDLQVKPIPYMSACHLNACLSLSIESNLKGWHSVAVSLLRQSVEALTILEIGLQDSNYAVPLLQAWAEGRKSQGELRKSLAKSIWPSYGTGLWDETWSEYFGNLARAVQPYAHYSPELQGWQWVTVKQLNERSFVLVIGPQTYDELKASRITLLHVLTGWTLARILLATDRSSLIGQYKRHIDELGSALAMSKLLFKGKDWAQQLMPHMWFKPGHSYRDG